MLRVLGRVTSRPTKTVHYPLERHVHHEVSFYKGEYFFLVGVEGPGLRRMGLQGLKRFS